MACPLVAVLGGIAGRPFGRWDGVLVTGMEVDSRRIAPGDLFVALPGLRAAGGDFVADALARGAGSLVLPDGRPAPPGIPGLHAADPRAALALAADAVYDRPSQALQVVGVTGSNGKTTVTAMLAHLLAAAGRPTGYWTTNEVRSPVRRFRPALTTPEAHDLQRFLRECLVGGSTHACVEVSSHAVVQRRILGVRFAAGIITGVAPDHIDFHGSFANYLAAKAAFLESLIPPAPCFYNLDDPGARRAVARVRTATVSYGFAEDADIRAIGPWVGEHAAGCAVRLAPRWLTTLPMAAHTIAPLRLTIPVPGRHNLQNALAALGAGIAMGVPAEQAATSLAAFQPVARRLRLQRAGGCTVIDDVAMNGASVDAVLSTVAELSYPQVVVVVALRGNRGADANARLAAALARWDRRLHFAPVIASLSRAALARYPLDYQVRPEEGDAFARTAAASGLVSEIHTELADAIRRGCARLDPGAALLLLGTFGMDEGAALAAHLLGGEAGMLHPPPSFG